MDKNSFLLVNIALQDKKVFRDAIHDYIHVDYDVILNLINSAAMQRLRRIKQLGGTYQVYQSAEHSRFTHSLGVYALVCRMIDESVVSEYLNDYEKLTVMIAGLLHDLGHGPYSHSFEDVFHHSHEMMTLRIIQEDEEVHKILENCVKGLSDDVCAVISKTHPKRILVQMISSQLDCDRMDYLLRDSYFTGTTYGQFDLSRILRVIQVKDDRIVFKKSGVQAIENYILARYHMYWQVYYHPSIRAYERLMISIFIRLKDLYHQGKDISFYQYLLPFMDKKITVKQYLDVDESICEYYFKTMQTCNDDILKDLSYRFLNRKLLHYEDYNHQEKQIIQDCLLKGYNPEYYVFIEDQSQIPYLHYDNKDDIREIDIIDGDKLVSLADVSEIVGAIIQSNKKKTESKIYYPL